MCVFPSKHFLQNQIILYPIIFLTLHKTHLFTIERPFGIRESIGRKVDHGGQIILWYGQHVTNLARVTVFIVCMSSAKPIKEKKKEKKKANEKEKLVMCNPTIYSYCHNFNEI